MKAVSVIFSEELVAKTRADAIRLGLIRYYPEKTCVYGHTEGRYTKHRQCVVCARLNARRVSLRVSRADPEANRQKTKEWQRNNRQRANAKKLAWYYQNKEKARASSLAWERANREKVRGHAHSRRAREIGAEGSYTPEDIERIWLAQRRRCALCKCRLTATTRTIDHIIALSCGGTNYPRNIQILCFSCNASKRDRDPLDHAKRKGFLL